MSTFRCWFEIFTKTSADFGVSKIGGTSLTIPGQGSDLAVIIQSIVKLPPIDERDYDTKANEDPDTRSLELQLQMESLYKAEAVNEAERALARQEQRKAKKDEKSPDDAPTLEGAEE